MTTRAQTEKSSIGEDSRGKAAALAPLAAIEVDRLSRRFGKTQALVDVSLRVETEEIHALLGPNGAGKTTLLKVLAGLMVPSAGGVRLFGVDASRRSMALRGAIGVVPSGDRSFYMRISGLENLVFFARLHGMSRKHAGARALEVLEQVDLVDAARRPMGTYSHGMQKRLSVARALLTSPAVLLVDEATHDLDPASAQGIRRLVSDAALAGTAVLWATQRLDEIRGFADTVTVLAEGTVRFAGTVAGLMAQSIPRRHVLRLSNCRPAGVELERAAQHALQDRGLIVSTGDAEHYVLALDESVVLGDALAALASNGIDVLSCREERSSIEDAFLVLTRGRS